MMGMGLDVALSLIAVFITIGGLIGYHLAGRATMTRDQTILELEQLVFRTAAELVEANRLLDQYAPDRARHTTS